jgi:hypothetical protein
MRHRQRLVFRTILCVMICSLAFLSCQKDKASDDGPTPPPPPPTVETKPFTTNLTSYVPYQVVEVAVQKGSFTAGEKVNGTIGTKAITLAILSDSLLAFMAPPEAAGTTQSLVFKLKEVNYKGNITVKNEAGVSQPDQYITTFTTGIETSLAGLKNLIVNDTTLSAVAINDIYSVMDVVKDSMVSFKKNFALLTAADKIVVANFMKVNLDGMTSLLNDLADYKAGKLTTSCNTGNAFQDYNCAWSEIGFQLERKLKVYAIIIAGSLVAGPVGVVGATISIAIGLKIGMDVGESSVVIGRALGATLYYRWTQVVDIYDYVAEFFRTTSISGSLSSFKNNVAAAFSFEAGFRNVQSGDVNSSSGFINSGLKALDAFNAFTGKISSKFAIKIAALKTKWRKPQDMSEISVAVVDNPKVKLQTFKGTPDKLEIAFATDELTDQPFKYDIVYKNAVYGQVKIRREATLTVPSYKVAVLEFGVPKIITGELAFEKDVIKSLKIMNDDGTVAQDIDYKQVSIKNSTNPLVTIKSQYLEPEPKYGVVLTFTTGEKYQVSFDVFYLNKKVQTINAVVDDGLSAIKKLVTGNWTVTYYYLPSGNGGSLHQIDKITLYADGTGKKTAGWNGDPSGQFTDFTNSTDPAYSLTWIVSGNSVAGFYLQYWDGYRGIPIIGKLSSSGVTFTGTLGTDLFRFEGAK